MEVTPDSPAFEAGLRPGDVILEMNRKTVNSAQSMIELSKKAKTSQALLRVWSKGVRRFMVIEPPKNRAK